MPIFELPVTVVVKDQACLEQGTCCCGPQLASGVENCSLTFSYTHAM